MFQLAGNTSSFILMGALLVVMFLVLVIPQNKKDKKDKQMRDNLQVGDEIITIGGIYGKVIRIRENRITIVTGAEKTKIEISRGAVNALVTEDNNNPGKVEKAVEEPKKSSPKKIKKLGEKKNEAAEAVAVAEDIKETAEEAVSTFEDSVDAE